MIKLKKIGGPGTGKTTDLLKNVTEDADRYLLREIGVVSHTKTAVWEAKQRIARKFDIPYKEIKEKLPGIRTIHAHCFHLLNQPKPADKEFAKFKKAFPNMDLNDKKSDAYKLFDEMQVLRNRMVPQSEWPDNVSGFYEIWSEWMADNNFLDFTGMMERCLADKKSPDFKVLYCDECQDQTMIACLLIRLWSEQCEKVVCYGDSDQALFRFAGAVPETFIDMPGYDIEYLEQSYRLPPAVFDYSQKIIQQISFRDKTGFVNLTEEVAKNANPPKKYHEGRILKNCEEPDLSLPGTHMVIAATQDQVAVWTDWLYARNIPFHNPYRKEDLAWNPQSQKIWIAIETFLRLQNNESPEMTDIQTMGDAACGRTNKKTGLVSAFLKGRKGHLKKREFHKGDRRDQWRLVSESAFSPKEDGFFNEDFLFDTEPLKYFKLTGKPAKLITHLLKNDNENFSEPPKVIVGTFHSVKGGEADNVWIDTGISYYDWLAIQKHEQHAFDDECRAMYVAITRSRNVVGFLNTQKKRSPVLI